MTKAWPPDVTLERGDIRLEPLSFAHEAGLREAAADGELWTLRVTSVPEPEKTRAYIEAALQQREEGNRLAFAVIDAKTNTVLGSTSYHDIVPAAKRVEIGYTWYRKSVQRSHVNTTCKLLLMQHAFETLQCPVVGWRTDILNFASQRAIEKLGARRDGAIRHHALRRDGTIRDTVIYSMLASEWPTAKEKLEKRLITGGFSQSSTQQPFNWREITDDNLGDVVTLNPGAVGERMIATNAASIARAAYSKNAVPRALFSGDTLVGFIMLYDPTIDAALALKDEVAPDVIGVWRVMIDFAQQGRGFGKMAMYEAWRYALSRPGCASVELHCSLEPGNAAPFYLALGYVDTGKVDDGESVMEISVEAIRERLASVDAA
jgi:N-acetyltransferase